MEISREITVKRLAELKPHPKNPRRHPDALIRKLVSSIETYGFTSPVLIDADGRILAGHARCKAAKKMGLTEVPTIALPLSGAAADSYVIVDNKLNELSGWDEEILSSLISDIDNSGFDVELTGFDIDEIDTLLSPKGCREDNFDIEKAKADIEENGGAVTREGDLWQLGEHRLLCGDPAAPASFDRLTAGQKSALALLQPPPCSDYKTHGVAPWLADFSGVAAEISRRADTAVCAVSDLAKTGTAFIEPLFAHTISCFAERGMRPLWVRVLQKEMSWLTAYQPPVGPVVGGSARLSDSEEFPVLNDRCNGTLLTEQEIELLTAFGQHTYRFVRRLSKEERKAWGVAHFWTLKPGCVALPWRCLKLHSDKGNTVLNPHAGDGACLVAAEQLERVCLAIERDPVACDAIIKRWETFTGQEAQKVC